MDTFRTGITGDKTLATINQIIAQQEKTNSEFLDSFIDYQDGKVINKVTFKLYDDNSVPKQLTLALKTAAAPANTAKVWEGVMAVENNLVPLIGYREN